MLAVQGCARFTLQKSHDAAYAGMLDTLTRLEADAMVDRIAIYRRGNIVLYDNERCGAGWLREPGARAAVEAERARPSSAQEQVAYARAWARVLQQRRARGARLEDLALARAERAHAILEIHAEPRAKAALAAQLDSEAFRRTERQAAAAAFASWTRQRATQCFPALAPYFEALTRRSQTPKAKRELARDIARRYPSAPEHRRSRTRSAARDPGIER